jgi:hypothetical protein
MRLILRAARPDDWTGTVAGLAVAVAFVLLVVLIALAPMPKAWVTLAWGLPLVVRGCLVLVVIAALAVAHAVLVARLPRSVVLWGRKVRFHDGTRRRAIPYRSIAAVHVGQRPPPLHEVFVIERYDGIEHDLCPTAWAGAPRLHRALERHMAAAARRRARANERTRSPRG